MKLCQLRDYLNQFDADCDVVLNGEDMTEEEMEHTVDLSIVFYKIESDVSI